MNSSQFKHLDELLKAELAVAVLIQVVAEPLDLLAGDVVAGLAQSLHQLLLRQPPVAVQVHVTERPSQVGFSATQPAGRDVSLALGQGSVGSGGVGSGRVGSG